jgi:exopolysaccharide production protein ExoQ
MPASVAAVAYSFLILALFLLSRDPRIRVSSGLWIPVLWLSIGASRFVSQWLDGVGSEAVGDRYIEGNLLDAAIFAGLLAAGLLVLSTRGRRVRAFLRANCPLLLFFLYCAISALWSDYPVVTFKRWVKAVGDLVMILVLLTDPEPTAAIKRLLARAGFVLIPLSILFIKYYPSIGRMYSPWTGEAFNTGVGTHKNSLGHVCLIFGLGAFWFILEAFRSNERERAARPIIAHGVILVMALWLFQMSNSATSFACFLIGCALLVFTSLFALGRKPVVVHLLVGTMLFITLFGVGIIPGSGFTEIIGRDSTLTGRTVLWEELLRMNKAPFFGVGYESFFLGERLDRIWMSGKIEIGVNQAHNGYIQVFLDLGWVGVVLLGFVMARGYQSVGRMLRLDPEGGRIRLAFFAVAMAYNLTEHAFRALHPVLIAFLLAVVFVPDPEQQNVYLGEDSKSKIKAE